MEPFIIKVGGAQKNSAVTIRAVKVDTERRYVLKDILLAMGTRVNVKNASAKLDAEDYYRDDIMTAGGLQTTITVNLFGFLHVVLGCRGKRTVQMTRLREWLRNDILSDDNRKLAEEEADSEDDEHEVAKNNFILANTKSRGKKTTKPASKKTPRDHRQRGNDSSSSASEDDQEGSTDAEANATKRKQRRRDCPSSTIYDRTTERTAEKPVAPASQKSRKRNKNHNNKNLAGKAGTTMTTKTAGNTKKRKHPTADTQQNKSQPTHNKRRRSKRYPMMVVVYRSRYTVEDVENFADAYVAEHKAALRNVATFYTDVPWWKNEEYHYIPDDSNDKAKGKAGVCAKEIRRNKRHRHSEHEEEQEEEERTAVASFTPTRHPRKTRGAAVGQQERQEDLRAAAHAAAAQDEEQPQDEQEEEENGSGVVVDASYRRPSSPSIDDSTVVLDLAKEDEAMLADMAYLDDTEDIIRAVEKRHPVLDDTAADDEGLRLDADKETAVAEDKAAAMDIGAQDADNNSTIAEDEQRIVQGSDTETQHGLEDEDEDSSFIGTPLFVRPSTHSTG